MGYLEWLLDVSFVWILVVGSIGAIGYYFFRSRDKEKEGQK